MLTELERVVEEREDLFKKHQIDSVAAFRALRAQGELPDEARGDVFLVVDGWATFRQEFEALEPVVTSLAARGLNFGIHVVLASGRWADFRAGLLDNIGGRLELRLNNAADSQIDRRAVAGLPRDAPGRAVTPSKLVCQIALPRLDGAALAGDLSAAYVAGCTAVREAWTADPAPPIRLLPRRVTTADLASSTQPGAAQGSRPAGVPVGLRESDMAPACIDLTAGDPHFLVLGDSESGKTTFLSTFLGGLAAESGDKEARVVVVDYRRTLLDVVPESHLEAYAGAAPAAQAALQRLHDVLVERLPGADVTTEQLRNRSWWTGPDYYVAVDDYDLVATSSGNPLQVLLDMLAQARDVGLHVIVARRVAGAAKALFEPVIARMRDVSPRGLILSGDRQEGVLIGPHRASEQVPGRGLLVTRGKPAELIQVAVPAGD
jgi:S-DNA-T family DNA segregation ATPase FtsK/SpoIIIE